MGVCINRYVGQNEKIQSLGEESNDRSQSSESHFTKISHPISAVDSVLQRDASASSSSAIGVSASPISPSSFDKIRLSLLSGLPNEQDFALNICTILSNEGQYILNLEKVPRLVDLLVAQTGIWRQDDQLKELYLESWKGLKGRDMHRFWRSTLDLQNSQLLQLLGLDLGECDHDEMLLNLEEELGILNVEGQRVLTVALILHNLSFEKNNVLVMVRSANFLRFLLLSVHSSWANIRQTAYDTLSNIACEIKLSIEKDICSRVLFQTVVEGIQSPDRFMSIRSMDILSQLCGFEQNEDIIPSRLDVEIYQHMVSFLTVHDIMLLFYTLEALYALSELGKYPCDKIACVHGSIGTLVSLLTLDPGQYGPSAQIKMKIVETMVPVDADDAAELESAAAAPQNDISTTTTSSTPLNKEVSSEMYANNWLKSQYDLCVGSMVSRNEIYAEYVSFCSKSGRKAVVNANVFAGCVKTTFPQCGLKRVQSDSGVITFHHDGLKKKCSVVQPIIAVSKPTSTTHTFHKALSTTTTVQLKQPTKLTQSPILKAQLSAPSKPVSPLSTKVSLPTVVTTTVSSIPVVPATATTTVPNVVTANSTNLNSSTLIKSLLANKVQQRNLQRQVVPQGVSRMVIFTPGKVGQTTTVMRCVAPGTLQQQIRSPLQARIVSNKSCIVASSPSTKILAPSPTLAPRLQTTTLRQIAVSAPTATLNGLQNEIKMEVCSDSEDTKCVKEVIHTPVIQTNCVQNHIAIDANYATKDLVSGLGNNFQESKDTSVLVDSDKNYVLSHIQGNSVTYRLAGPNELPVSAGNLLFVRSKPSDGLSTPKDQNGPGILIASNSTTPGLSLMTQPIIQPKIISPNSSILHSVLNEFSTQSSDVSKLQQIRKDEICKKSPLLNGLLDKGKVALSGDFLSSALLQNGSEPTELNLELTQPSVPMHVSMGQKVIPLNSIVPSSLNSIVIPTASLNSVIIPTSSLTSAIMPTSSIIEAPSQNSIVTYLPAGASSLVSGAMAPSPATVTLASNGTNVVQIRTGQTTFSGTAEVQPDQKGVVRLHIESPENSNHGSDLSSISDIARTLECASQAISKTNAECNTQVLQQPVANPTSATVAVINTSAPTVARGNQQIIVVTPTINQQQLQTSPNFKFCILQSLPQKTEEQPMELIGFPQINLNQLQQQTQPQITLEVPSAAVSLKRPSTDSSPTCIVTNVKKPRVEVKTPPSVLETSLMAVPASSSTSSVGNAEPKSRPDSPSVKTTQIENLAVAAKLVTTSAIPVQNAELPGEKETKTFSGLSSASDNPSLSSPAPPKSSTTKLEYVCEWKNCKVKFSSPGLVFLHASKVHTPAAEGDMMCLWEGCDSMKRKRFSLLTHLQDWHCNERVLHNQAMRRLQLAQSGKTTINPAPKPPPHPGYAPDAALLAVKRHALQYINPKELSEEKESALTKSIRLTSALILRNLVTHSSQARTYVRRFEPELAYLAMSPVESARTIAQCLSHLSGPYD